MNSIVVRYELRVLGTMRINGATVNNAKERVDKLINNYNLKLESMHIPTTEGDIVKLDVDFAEIETSDPYEEDN